MFNKLNGLVEQLTENSVSIENLNLGYPMLFVGDTLIRAASELPASTRKSADLREPIKATVLQVKWSKSQKDQY